MGLSGVVRTRDHHKFKIQAGLSNQSQPGVCAYNDSLEDGFSLKVYFLHTGKKQLESSSNTALCSKVLKGKKICKEYHQH